MAPKSIKGSPVLAKIIKARRLELGLTIEEAAFKAGVGTKTWSRYESGESIRADKYKGVCKALEWKKLPDIEKDYEKIIQIFWILTNTEHMRHGLSILRIRSAKLLPQHLS